MISTYNQLAEIVAPVLEHYKEDLTKHDFNALKEYDGKFLYGYRPTGTDLLRMKPNFKAYYNEWKEHIKTLSIDEAEKLMVEDIIWIIYPHRNTKFLYFDGTKFHHITAQRANLLYVQHIQTVCENHKIKQQLKTQTV